MKNVTTSKELVKDKVDLPLFNIQNNQENYFEIKNNKY